MVAGPFLEFGIWLAFSISGGVLIVAIWEWLRKSCTPPGPATGNET